uniref:Uncharacterized protein n=1 Tax=Caenorhabditis japonica TaxID=281687 RepID=A0A8R1HZD9_CAEJA
MKVLTVTIADVYGFSTTSFRYDFLGVVVSMIMAISGAFLCFESGPLYQNIIDDIQTLTCGLFLTAQLLIVIECYGIDQIYLDIYALMRPPGNWNRFYCLSMWSSRWRMAPAFTLIYAFLPFLLRTHSNMHNDVDYVYFYEEHLPERDPEDKRGNWEQMYILADTELTEKEKKELMRNNRDSASH